MSRRKTGKAETLSLRSDQTAVWAVRGLLQMERELDLIMLLRDDDLQRTIVASSLLDGRLHGGEDERTRARRLADRLREHLAGLGDAVPRAESFIVNAELLGRTLGLERAEVEMMALMVAANIDSGLENVLERLPKENRRLCRALAAILDVDPAAMRRALDPRSFLASARILQRAGGSRQMPLDCSSEFVAALTEEHPDLDSLLRTFFGPSPAPRLSRSDFPGIERQVEIVVRLLARAMAGRARGTNVLIYGPPGTGKTELARLAAAEAGARLYEIAAANAEGGGMGSENRVVSCLLAQAALQRQAGSAILFDEVEDVLGGGFSAMGGLSLAWGRRRRVPSVDKGYLNRVLEDNPVPVLWVSNSVDGVDPAYLRRFALSVEVPVPPRPVRRSILQKHLGGLDLDPRTLDALADNAAISPADVEKAARVTAACGPGDRAEAERIVTETLRMGLALSGETMALPAREGFELEYDLRCLNADVDLERLAASLDARCAGAVCLYGRPGTGKTAFARYLARRLGRELVTKRASDLLSMWVGGTEAHIAAMFRQADPDHEVLLLDEADSFFRSRELARHSWEVTGVNELLVQMEGYRGLFLCSTNLVDDFDPAAFRRFALKIRFDYPDAARRWSLFENALRALGRGIGPGEEAGLRKRIDALHVLAPGDVAAALSRARMLAELPGPGELASMLEDECAWKKDGARPVGFGPR